LTVIGIGDNLKDQFHIGQRFIIQADVYYKGENPAYGYQLDGGMAQYGVVTKEVLNGDEGLYLLPTQDDTGYVEAALVEPWACVVAAYEYPNYRDGLLDGGRLLVVGGTDKAQSLIGPGHQPASVTSIDDAEGTDFAQLRTDKTGGAGFDDILVYGTPSADALGCIAGGLGKRGVLNLISAQPPQGKVPVDVGRIHYEQHLFVGTNDPTKAAEAYTSNSRAEIKPGGRTWFVGAGGPMGQMHVQRAVMLPEPPATIVVTDMSDDRLERLRTRFGKMLAEQGIALILVNPNAGGDPAQHGPYDDIVSMVPVASVISDSMPLLAENGVYNIFAGLAKGTMADLDLGAILAKNQRIVGTSGSSIADLRHTLELVESDALSTNSSLAAIGGLDAFRDGLAAVKEGRFPGKTVIFPQMPDLPLLSIEDLKTQMPNVYAKLQDGLFWTKEAEEELLRENLK
ncbi:MAG: hypothetical protein M3Y28_12050, partial [Armatimonadota bacterium]|nr:hypothetical protein [Armatimonadota bacterium]